MAEASDPRVEHVRLLYENDEISLREIARRAGTAESTVRTWIKRYAWPPRKPPALARAASGTEGGAVCTGQPAKPARRPRRRNRPSVKSLIDRIYRVITHNLDVMEQRMSEDDETAAGANPDRDVRAINSLVRSVEKLKELEPDTAKRDPVSEGRYPLTREEEDQLRDEIVERLLELRKRRRDQGPAE